MDHRIDAETGIHYFTFGKHFEIHAIGERIYQILILLGRMDVCISLKNGKMSLTVQ